MTNKHQDDPAAAHLKGCVAKLATANEGVKSVGAGMKSLVALLDLINSPSTEVSDQLRLQLSASALRISRRILTESYTAHKQVHAQLRALGELTVIESRTAESPAKQAGPAAAGAAAEPCEVTRHG